MLPPSELKYTNYIASQTAYSVSAMSCRLGLVLPAKNVLDNNDKFNTTRKTVQFSRLHCKPNKQLSYRRGTALQCGSVVAQISMLFSVLKEHCCRLLLQLVSPVNRQRLKCHKMQRRRANGWFTSRTKFVCKGMSPTNYLCTDRQASKCLTTLPLTVFAQSISVEIPSQNRHKTVTLHF